jgi:lipoyl-dependent peroxiredoxin
MLVKNVVYTAEAHVTGGRASGHGRTSDGLLDVLIRMPKELGGEGGATNPEQLFAVGYAACFESALMLAARRRRLVADDVAVDSRVMLISADAGRYKLAAELDITLPSVADPEQAAELVGAAYAICPYSNATRGNMEVAIAVNGAPLIPSPTTDQPGTEHRGERR